MINDSLMNKHNHLYNLFFKRYLVIRIVCCNT